MQSKNNQSTIFTTSDLNTASVLLAFEVPLESINRSNPKKVSFTFGPRLMVNDLVQQYRTRKLLIEPTELFNAQRNLKNLIFAE